MSHRVEEKQSLLVHGQRGPFRKRAQAALDLRRKPCQLRREFPADFAQRLRVLQSANPVLEGVGERQIRRGRFVFVARAGECDCALDRRIHEHLAAEAGFPGAGLAAE